METTAHSETKHDITQEPYKGPGALVTALGYYVIEWKIATVAAMSAGLVMALTAPKFFNAQADKLKTFVADWVTAAPRSKRWTGKALNWCVETSRNIAGKTPEWLLKRLGKERSEAMIFTGGMGAVAGLLGSTVTSAFHGTEAAHAGRDQFNLAKQEIKDLRTENAALRAKDAEIIAEIVSEVNRAQPQEPTAEPASAPVPTAKIDAASATHLASGTAITPEPPTVAARN